MESVKVEFETITPIYTGDAWGNCTELKQSAIMGSLRFWFEVYCCCIGIEVSLEKESLDYNWFKSELIKRIEESLKETKKVDTEKIAFEIAKEKLTLSSLIFGCTGWKSRVDIENIEFENRTIVETNSFDYNYLHDKDNNTSWWTKKVLFNTKSQIDIFENVVIQLKVKENILEEVKKFFKFYEDKPILIGGKKTFGFGFVKLKSDLDLNNIDIDIKKDNIVIWDTVNINHNITGYNIKYFLRKKEKDKKIRVKNFGKMSQASNFYFSMPKDGKVHIIAFSNKTILDEYKKRLEEAETKQYSNKQTKNKKHKKKDEKVTIDDLKKKWSSR